MTQLQKTLTKCGFSPFESKIYLALLQNNNLKAGQIAKVTGIKRASVYTSLDSLTKKGLVSISTDNGILFFRAEPPLRIMEYLENQQSELNDKVSSLKKVKNELDLLQKNELNIPKISIFTGDSGVKTLLEQTLNDKKETVLIFGNYTQKGDPIPFFTLKRKSEKIKAKLITPKNEHSINASKKDITDIRQTTFIPNKYSFPASIHISGNKVTLFTHSNQHSVGVFIQDKDIAKTLSSLHQYIQEYLKVNEK